MADLAEIITKLEQTKEALARTERELLSSPEDRSLLLTHGSLEKRQRELNRQLEQATAQLHEPVASN